MILKYYFQANDIKNAKTVVVSMCPQSRASLAAKYKLNIDDAAKKLTGFFHNLGK